MKKDKFVKLIKKALIEQTDIENLNDRGDPEYRYGCTDPEANNYNPNANTDDGSCAYSIGPNVADVNKDTDVTQPSGIQLFRLGVEACWQITQVKEMGTSVIPYDECDCQDHRSSQTSRPIKSKSSQNKILKKFKGAKSIKKRTFRIN